MKLSIGLDTSTCLKLAQLLSRILGDTYVLAVKTQGFHWNVTGNALFQLHAAFGDQYESLSGSIDGIAERIRALGHNPPSSLKAILGAATLKEQDGIPSAQAMVSELLANHESAAKMARAVAEIAAKSEDQITATLLADLGNQHEKTAWMLRSYLETSK
jgi:starvation-inducible DNA-binding protein